MKNLTKIAGSVLLSFVTAIASAQDTVTKSSSSVSTTTTTWYTEPWAWALGAAVLIIIIVAIARGGSSTVDRVTVTKKVERE